MTLPKNPRTRDDLILRHVDEDFVVYDPMCDRLAVLNQSAALVFDLCDGSNTFEDIVAEVARVFVVHESTEGRELHTQIRESLLQLAGKGMLQPADR